MIKSIIFDLGNVIVNVDKSDFYNKIAKAGGKSIADVEDFCENSSVRANFEKGKLSAQDFYETCQIRMSFTLSS